MNYQTIPIQYHTRCIGLICTTTQIQVSKATKIPNTDFSYIVEDNNGYTHIEKDYNSVLKYWKSKYQE